MAGAAGGVVLKNAIQILYAVPVASIEIEFLPGGTADVRESVPIAVRVVDIGAGDRSMRPVVVVIECREVREVRIGPSGWHLLLVGEEQLPCVLGQIGLPYRIAVCRRIINGPCSAEVCRHALRAVDNDPLA